jgi:hypothetical protein
MIGRPKQLGVAVNREKLGQTIRKIIYDHSARSLGERTEIYSAARTSVRKATNGEPAIMADVDEVIDEIEADYTPKPETRENRGGGARRALAMLVAGALLGGVAAAATMMVGFHFRPIGPVAVELKRQYDETRPLMPAAVDYLHRVAEAVIGMQRTDPAALEAKAANKFVPVAALDPELAKKLPSSMPAGSGVLVRADKDDYKILFGWTLCGAARFAKPEMVDPVRTRANVLGCPFFGVWTPGAAKW